MIIGQETDGWCGVLEQNQRDIISVQDTYFNYLYENKDKFKRPFWNRKNFKYYQEEISKIFSTQEVAFIWNNVSKIGKNSRGKPTKKIENLEKEYFNVFEEELQILKPDIMIFVTGNRKIPIKYKKIKSIKEEPVSKLELENYPNIMAVRTYHPNARIKGGKKEFKKEILDLIQNNYEIPSFI